MHDSDDPALKTAGPFVSEPPALNDQLLSKFKALAFSSGEAPEVFKPDDDPDAPALPLSIEEPTPVPKQVPPKQAVEPLETLRRLAGPSSDPVAAKDAFIRAIFSKAHDPQKLPEVQHMIIAMCRVMLAHGVVIEDLVSALDDAMRE